MPILRGDDKIVSSRNIGMLWYSWSKIVITWRWPLLAETCSYFLLLNTIINPYYHSCVFMTDIYLTVSNFVLCKFNFRESLFLPLALQPTVNFGLSNNVFPFFPICHQLSPSSHSLHLKISFYFLCPSFSGSSPSSRPFQFLSEHLFGHPILLHSL